MSCIVPVLLSSIVGLYRRSLGEGSNIAKTYFLEGLDRDPTVKNVANCSRGILRIMEGEGVKNSLKTN